MEAVMDEWTSQTVLEVRDWCVCVSVGVCVCASHTDLLGLLQPSIHSCGKCRQTIDPLKLAVRATCLPLTKTETPEQAGQRCREQEGRRGGWAVG